MSADVPGIGDERTEGERRSGRMKTVLVIMLLKVSVGNGCEIHVQRTTGQLLVTACSHNCPDSSSHLAGPYHLLSCGELPVRTQSSHPDTHHYPVFVYSRSGKIIFLLDVTLDPDTVLATPDRPYGGSQV